jgi:hypothetical protein
MLPLEDALGLTGARNTQIRNNSLSSNEAFKASEEESFAGVPPRPRANGESPVPISSKRSGSIAIAALHKCPAIAVFLHFPQDASCAVVMNGAGDGLNRHCVYSFCRVGFNRYSFSSSIGLSRRSVGSAYPDLAQLQLVHKTVSSSEFTFGASGNGASQPRGYTPNAVHNAVSCPCESLKCFMRTIYHLGCFRGTAASCDNREQPSRIFTPF